MSDVRTPDLGFMAQMLVQATLPHKKPTSSQFTRINGNFRLTLMAPSHIGLPYGRYPRLALAWLSSEVVRTRSQRLYFGASLSAFMRATGIEASATGGPYGTLTRFAIQARRLFASTIHCSYLRPDGRAALGAAFTVARSHAIWWTPKVDHHTALLGSCVELSDDFFRSIIANPVPIDLAVLRALRSPFALDIYVWLTYRMSYLRQPAQITWRQLAFQFGSEYGDVRHFRFAFIQNAKKILVHYPAARLAASTRGLTLYPSPTHILPEPGAAPIRAEISTDPCGPQEFSTHKR
jgi:hypothetical protein